MNGLAAEKKRIFAFDMLKLIAVLLILNSHFDSLYPDKLKILATGGIWGNTIFFVISGYFTNINGSFFQYMKKKIVRLYPAVTIVTFVTLVFHLRNIRIENIADIVTEFIWPTYYWFVGALVLFYLLIYLLERKKMITSKFIFFSAFLNGILLLYYECCIPEKSVWCIEKMGFDSLAGWIKMFFFFYIFAMGYYLKKNDNICHKISRKGSVCFTLFGGVGYIGYKLLLAKNYIPMNFQIFSVIFAYFLALGVICLALKLKKDAEYSGSGRIIVKNIVTGLSALSLEVYLTQFTVIHFFEGYRFPFNVIMTLLVCFGCAYLLQKVSSYISDKLTEW